MALKYLELSAHPEEMAAGELLQEAGGLDDSKLMRSLLMAELALIRAQGPRPDRTLRSLWYSLVKPALSRMGKLNETTRSGRPKDWDGKLSSTLGKLVAAGVTTYEEFGIVDGSRQRQQALPITQSVVSIQLTGPHAPHVVLCSEKDTIYPVIQQVAELYGVSCYSGGGQPAKAATENLVLNILRHRAYRGQGITILSLTDYDPAGYSIAGSFFAQVQQSLRGRGVRATHHRLGLEPWQLTEEELAQNVYEPKDQGLREWLEETGGVNGQPYGLELDALPLARLRGMFAEGIEAVIDIELRERDLREAMLEMLAYELLMPEFRERLRGLLEAARGSRAGQELASTALPAGLFREAAIQGANAIDPLEEGLFDTAAIESRMRAHLENGH